MAHEPSIVLKIMWHVSSYVVLLGGKKIWVSFKESLAKKKKKIKTKKQILEVHLLFFCASTAELSFKVREPKKKSSDEWVTDNLVPSLMGKDFI